MILSPGRRYIFVHIPKTGGTAMAMALEDRARADDILIGDTPKANRRRHRLTALRPAGRLWKHSTLADIEGVVDRAAFDDFLIFTLVRNPWDRMVSYYHWLRAQSFVHPAVARAQSLPFADFLAHPASRAAIRANPYPRYLTDGAGQERAGHYLRVEHLEADLAPVAAHLGFMPRPGRQNASDRRRDWRSYYPTGLAEIVAQDCAADIARFGYRFDPEGPA